MDLQRSQSGIESYIASAAGTRPRLVFLPNCRANCDSLDLDTVQLLDQTIADLQVRGVIIATDPLNHVQYGEWAMSRGLSVLLDKPISTRKDVSTEPEEAIGLLDDYRRLMTAYEAARRRHGRLLFSIAVQRRYHPMFRKVRELIKAVLEKTNCPVTSIQVCHSDGQWYFPREIAERDNHPVNLGYGKCSHSGYHFYDILSWFLQAGESSGKTIDNVDVCASFVRPADLAAQLTHADYKRLFANYDSYGDTADHVMLDASRFGEIDAFTSFAFRKGAKTLSLGAVNLLHNGFSQRGWASSAGRDLYKGNGRVRHEFYYIVQGPFQAISLSSYQSREVDPGVSSGLYDVGGEYHLEAHVFRNANLFPDWRSHQTVNMENLYCPIMQGRSRGHQEDAKRSAVLELIAFIRGEPALAASDLATHKRSVALMSGVYQSAARSSLGSGRNVNIDFTL